MSNDEGVVTSIQDPAEPTLQEIADALAHHVAANGAVRPGVTSELVEEKGWHGRLIDILDVLTEDTGRMGYLAGGHKPSEVMTWLPLWANSPFSLEQIRTIVAGAGWDPEPFEVVARLGLLERFVYEEDGTLRRIGGELAGAWLSDQFALASDEEIAHAVQDLLADNDGPRDAAPTLESEVAQQV